jgi:hypothetical protein
MEKYDEIFYSIANSIRTLAHTHTISTIHRNDKLETEGRMLFMANKTEKKILRISVRLQLNSSSPATANNESFFEK